MRQHVHGVSRSSTWAVIGALLLATGLAEPIWAQSTTKLTYVDLVKRLTDMEHLATLPPPGEKCAQWSSWDRRSKYDATADQYVNWDANG
ncbi:MAG: hypothetical protein JSW27_25130, partial [Phycisphaerales bacterium]